MQGRQDSAVTGGCSLCRPDFAAREAAPGSNWQWPNCDTEWRHLKGDRDAAARELVACVFVQVRVRKSAVATICCRHARIQTDYCN